ncbi:MAG: hypothetical protein F4069_05325 [Rhodothermaceae bacterium]|nr:hypothetical protein [Rhodothermaceae bacterium]MXZ18775.1 hypothetical protein [Rhodothermaceae bacterium]MYE63269.1 hypothetical protein [Rhodothermaceae bacterium]MYG70245.1 hypothetical protein [Rhodothermaceae bacterium]MYJ19909.1 hypothetical protein [Rhodothermaceae bacterium]
MPVDSRAFAAERQHEVTGHGSTAFNRPVVPGPARWDVVKNPYPRVVRSPRDHWNRLIDGFAPRERHLVPHLYGFSPQKRSDGTHIPDASRLWVPVPVYTPAKGYFGINSVPISHLAGNHRATAKKRTDVERSTGRSMTIVDVMPSRPFL